MELSNLQEAEKLLNELTKEKPDELTLKLALITLYKKMSKPIESIYPIYDKIMGILIDKSDSVSLARHSKGWLDSLSDAIIVQSSKEIINRLSDITHFISDQAIIEQIYQLLLKMSERNLVNFQMQAQILNSKILQTNLSCENFEEFEAKLVQEIEMEKSFVKRQTRISFIFEQI